MSTARGGWELPISEDELTRLTAGMAEAHLGTLSAMRASAAELTEQITAGGAARGHTAQDGSAQDGSAQDDPAQDDPAGPGRRRFLLGAAGAGAAFLLAACSSDKGSAAPPAAKSASPVVDKSVYTGDLKIVALAVALENQAVGVYKGTLAAAKAGKLGTVPPAVTTFVTTAMAQHADHAKAWNAVLTGARKPAITGVPLSNQKKVTTALGKATNVGAVSTLALQLEDQAAQTYLFATYNVKSAAGIRTAATIAPVEAMHATILNFFLGETPVPEAFLPVDLAAKPSLLTV
ncbi:ferritin-like domain-containing protein [Streptomyces sp. NPDC058200]|uniref:ferritin-like domain-containing protein n=1 Tax=Streptomyces sp. NPDC058200 TaxID=3346378 RepID=UPI0036ED1A73